MPDNSNSNTQLSLFNEDEFKSPFDRISHKDDNGNEYWLARELMTTIDYGEWRKFKPVIVRAMNACSESGFVIIDHFVVMDEMVNLGSGSKRKVDSYKLTRYACYLIAMNGDTSKKIIAEAQTYFAQQTRRAELRDEKDRQAQLDKRGRDVTAYRIRGKSEEWAESRVASKEATAQFNNIAAATHQDHKPDYKALHGIVNRAIFEDMTKDEIVEYLGLLPKDADKYREHLGQYALDALKYAYQGATARFKQTGKPLTHVEQKEIVKKAIGMIAPALKEFALFVGEDFVSGAALDSNGNALIQRNVPLLSRGQ